MSILDDSSRGSLLTYAKGGDDDEGHELKSFHDLVEIKGRPPSTVGIDVYRDLL